MTDAWIATGRRIAAARGRVGMSQRDLAAKVGLSQPTIQRIEKGEREASLLELSVIAEECGAFLDELEGKAPTIGDVSCAGRTDDAGAKALADYLLLTFDAISRLDRLGIPEVS